MKKIIVLGDTIIDEYIYLDTQKISDEAPVITHQIVEKKYVLGGGANVARNIKSLGKDVFYFGLCNEKDTITSKLLDDFNINYKLFELKNSVPIKTRIISRNQQICRFDTTCKPKINEEIKIHILDFLKKNLNNIEFVVISKYFDGFLTPEFINKFIEICNKNNIKSIFDNRQNNSSLYKGISFLKLNFNEFQNLVDKKINNNNDEISNEIKKLFLSLSYDCLILTRSEKDIICVSKNFIKFFPIEKSEVVDVSGAGDTFVATFASFFNSSKNIDEIINLSKLSSKISISKLGTSVVYEHELFLHSNNLKNTINHIKKNYNKIVFTNGVFDILHIGHLKLLKEAKENGDFLIVGINSDKSVRKLKGKNRPIKSEEDRKKILESIKYVDYVFVFDELNVNSYLELIKPDLYVKGSDYDLSNLSEGNLIKELGIKTLFIEFEKNKSTSMYIEKIIERNNEND